MSANDSVTDSSCVTRAATGVGAGVVAAVVAAGVVVAFKGPSARISPVQRAKELIGLLAPFGAVVGATYGFVECATEAARNRTDVWNSMIGGCAAGTVVGMHRRSMASAAFGCLALGAAGGLADANKYMFAPAPVVAQTKRHSEDMQTSQESVDAFATADLK